MKKYRILEQQNGNKSCYFYVQKRCSLFFGLLKYWRTLDSSREWGSFRDGQAYGSIEGAKKALESYRKKERDYEIVNTIIHEV